MPQITIDGNIYEAKTNQTVIEAAYQNGLEITHFCWHPELSVSGNCRMCLVEIGMPARLPDGTFDIDQNGKTKINYFPKLQIACSTQVAEGMHVRTKSDMAIKAQEAVMEFILINHPLDCPICDEAGQCKLQEYAFMNSSGESRFNEEKNHKPKRKSWGPNVLFDAERCISCSRCIRFAKEVANQEVLSFVNRGDHVTIKLTEGTQFDSPYSMNVIDICPVGALTGKDFRFKSRVWDMSFNDSVCPGCSRGCNTKIGVRNNEILRIEPRPNPYVNKFWMCDYGRFVYQEKPENRLNEPLVKKDGVFAPVLWNDAFALAASELSKFKPSEIMFLGSARASNEDNFLLSRFAKSVIKSQNIDFIKHLDAQSADNFLQTGDLAPNSAGAAETGVSPLTQFVNMTNLNEKIQHGEIKALFLMDNDLRNESDLVSGLSKLELLIVLAGTMNSVSEKAHILLPVSTWAESQGTWVNINGRVQHFTPALVTAENIRYMGMKMSRLDKFGSHNDRWSNNGIRKSLPSWKIILSIANQFGAGWKHKKAEDVFYEIVSNISGFKGMTYGLLDEYQGLILGKADKPDPKVINYNSHFLKPV